MIHVLLRITATAIPSVATIAAAMFDSEREENRVVSVMG
jgi:hypothetical protein